MAEINVPELQKIFLKTLQAYRMRFDLLEKRRWILTKNLTIFINRKPRDLIDRMNIQEAHDEKLRNDATRNSIASELGKILRSERRLLNVILTEDNTGKNQIEIALDLLQSHVADLEARERIDSDAGRSALNYELRDYGIKRKDLVDACRAGVMFLALARGDLEKIKQRVSLEEKFISNPTEENIKGFLKAWDMEIYANRRLLAHLGKVINKTLLTKRKFLLQALGRAFNSVRTKASSEGFASAIGASLTILSFLTNLYNEYKGSKYIQFDKQETLILWRLEKLNKLKIHWWNRL